MNLVASALARITVGPVSTFRNVSVFPLYREAPTSAGYHTLDQALCLGGITVTEVSEAGSVPQLKVTSTLDRPVLLLDGEELVGAKQNRVFNLTILVPAAAELLVPVSCVEAGRWQRASAEFRRAGRAQYAAGRAARVAQVSDSLERHRRRESEQHEVWRDIADKRRRMGVDSRTGAMADIYMKFERAVDDYVRGLPADDAQIGAVVAIGGEVVGLDVFDSATTFHAHCASLVRSYALDALESPHEETATTADAASAFLEAVAEASSASFKAIGLGEDLRLRGNSVQGAALAVDGAIVHLCAYRASAR